MMKRFFKSFKPAWLVFALLSFNANTQAASIMDIVSLSASDDTLEQAQDLLKQRSAAISAKITEYMNLSGGRGGAYNTYAATCCEVLEIDPETATLPIATKAYRRMALKLHPDKAEAGNAIQKLIFHEVFATISTSYTYLTYFIPYREKEANGEAITRQDKENIAIPGNDRIGYHYPNFASAEKCIVEYLKAKQEPTIGPEPTSPAKASARTSPKIKTPAQAKPTPKVSPRKPTPTAQPHHAPVHATPPPAPAKAKVKVPSLKIPRSDETQAPYKKKPTRHYTDRPPTPHPHAKIKVSAKPRTAQERPTKKARISPPPVPTVKRPKAPTGKLPAQKAHAARRAGTRAQQWVFSFGGISVPYKKDAKNSWWVTLQYDKKNYEFMLMNEKRELHYPAFHLIDEHTLEVATFEHHRAKTNLIAFPLLPAQRLAIFYILIKAGLVQEKLLASLTMVNQATQETIPAPKFLHEEVMTAAEHVRRLAPAIAAQA